VAEASRSRGQSDPSFGGTTEIMKDIIGRGPGRRRKALGREVTNDAGKA
jgi:hypothetical protein